MELAVEAGRIVAVPQVLSRGDDAVVVLTRLTAVGTVLSLEILSVATGRPARAVFAGAFPPGRPPGVHDDPGQVRAAGPGAAVAVLHDGEAAWAVPHEAETTGDGTVRTTAEYRIDRPAGRVLDLVVAWPAAGLPDVCVAIPLR